MSTPSQLRNAQLCQIRLFLSELRRPLFLPPSSGIVRGRSTSLVMKFQKGVNSRLLFSVNRAFGWPDSSMFEEVAVGVHRRGHEDGRRRFTYEVSPPSPRRRVWRRRFESLIRTALSSWSSARSTLREVVFNASKRSKVEEQNGSQVCRVGSGIAALLCLCWIVYITLATMPLLWRNSSSLASEDEGVMPLDPTKATICYASEPESGASAHEEGVCMLPTSPGQLHRPRWSVVAHI